MDTVAGRTAPVFLRPTPDLEAEMPALWAVQDAARVADGEVERSSLQGFTTYYRHLEHCDTARDLIVAEVDGRVVAYARVEWQDSNDGERWYEGTCHIHPAWRRRGIGGRLLAWTEARRLAIAAEQAVAGGLSDRVRAITTFILDGDRGGAALLRRAGYVPFRRFASMRRSGLTGIPDLPLPDGIDVRPVARERAAMRRVFDADVEAFRDHFGWSEGSDEKFEEFIGYDNVDPALWVVAFVGDEVAAACLNAIHVDADGRRTGWLDSIFTRRPWRQRGLARALIARSLALLREQGLDDAYLGVDLANPNQALALYESCGFAVLSGATAYRRPVPSESFGAGERPSEIAP